MSKYICSSATKSCDDCDHSVPHTPFIAYEITRDGKKIGTYSCVEQDYCDKKNKNVWCVEVGANRNGGLE